MLSSDLPITTKGLVDGICCDGIGGFVVLRASSASTQDEGFDIMCSADAREGWPDVDRRQFRRFPTALTVRVWRDSPALIVSEPGRDRHEEVVVLQLRDFSLGGLRGGSRTPLLVGEGITVSLLLAGARPRVFLTGRVTHCHKEGHKYNIGVEFCQIRDDVENSPWLHIVELFCVTGGERTLVQ